MEASQGNWLIKLEGCLVEIVRTQNKTGQGMGHKYTTCPPLGDFTGILNGNKTFIDNLHEKWESNHENIYFTLEIEL